MPRAEDQKWETTRSDVNAHLLVCVRNASNEATTVVNIGQVVSRAESWKTIARESSNTGEPKSPVAAPL
jgi:hypothetical protein